MPFENRSGVGKLDWMRAALPVALSEKIDSLRRFRPVLEREVIDAKSSSESEQSIAEFAIASGASWVWTGWFDRPDWQFSLHLSLWHIEKGVATEVFTGQREGSTDDVHKFIGALAIESFESQRWLLSDTEKESLLKPVTADLYAFTLFGRGVAAWVGLDGKQYRPSARKNFEKVLLIDPGFGEANRFAAMTYLQLGKNSKVSSRLARALEAQPDDAAALREYYELRTKQGLHEEARDLLYRLLKQRPWNLELRLVLGKLHWRLGETDEAYKVLRDLERFGFKNPDVRRTLILVHASRGSKVDLVAELEKLAKEEPGDIEIQLELAAAYVAAGRTADSIVVYERVISVEPENIVALKFLGDSYRRLGRLNRAIRYYGLAVRAKPTDPRSYFLLGATYVEVGDDARAKQVYTRAQKFPEYLPDAYNNLGAIAYRDGKLYESLWYLKRAVAKRSLKPRYRYNYALSLSATRQEKEALVEIDAALQLEPDNAEMHYLRGVILLRKGDAAEAEKSFKKTLALAPGHEGAAHNLERLGELLRRTREGVIQGAK